MPSISDEELDLRILWRDNRVSILKDSRVGNKAARRLMMSWTVFDVMPKQEEYRHQFRSAFAEWRDA